MKSKYQLVEELSKIIHNQDTENISIAIATLIHLIAKDSDDKGEFFLAFLEHSIKKIREDLE